MINNDKSINNRKNIFTSQYYMIKTLGLTELNDSELNKLMKTFAKDLFTDYIMDINKREDNMNLIANLIKELDEDNQIVILEKLEKEKEAKNNQNLIKDLKDRIVKLNLLKDEIREENEEDLENQVEDDDEELLEDSEDIEQTMTVEISADDIDEDDIKEICQVFKVNYENEDNKNKRNKNMSFLANSIVKFNEKSQKKITDKLENNLKNEGEKNQFEELLQNLQILNNCKKIGKEIKDKKEQTIKDFKAETENVLKLSDNCKKNLNEENKNQLKEELINELFKNIQIDFDKNELIKEYILESKRDIIIWKSAWKINSLSEQDKESFLNEIKSRTNNSQYKNDIYNKLCKAINILEKIKSIKNDIELKKNDLIYSDELNMSTDKRKEKLESLIQKLNKKNIQKDDIINIVNEIMKFDDVNQENFLNYLRENIKSDEKDFIMKQIENNLNKMKIQKTFAYKVLESYLQKIIIEKEKNEKKYGIFVDYKDKKGTLLLKKPNELKIENFNAMKNNIIDDLKTLNEQGEKDNDISYIDLYKRQKEKEKKLEEISDLINSLYIDDKLKILEEIRKNFDIPKNNDLYNEFLEIFEKKERRFNEEKREKKKETYKEIEEKKEDEEMNLLYSYNDVIVEKNNSSDIVNYSEDAFDSSNKIREISGNKNFTFHKGNLETEEIY